jgi:hypothetical protein
MIAPNVHIFTNALKMMVYCDFFSFYSVYTAYNLYYSSSSSWSGTLIGKFPNVIDLLYSKNHVMIPFTRPVPEASSYYLRLVGVFSGGSEDSSNPGAIKYVPAVSESLPLYKPVQIEGFDATDNVYRPVLVDTTGKLL